MIDFAWAADPDYVHTTAMAGDVTLNFYNQPNAEYDQNWADLPEYTAKAMAFLSDLIGPYPYPQYLSFRAVTAAWSTRWPRSSPGNAASAASSG